MKPTTDDIIDFAMLIASFILFALIAYAAIEG